MPPWRPKTNFIVPASNCPALQRIGKCAHPQGHYADRAELTHDVCARFTRAGDLMFFDDRLATVLRHRAAGEHAARTQFRQLLDLLGNRKYGRDESLIAAARSEEHTSELQSLMRIS